ncbi:hypothetical protein AVEN_78409-1 [Araneus ventricosus]|uniref:Uncharacterized protein n=1 Tax=Araneus ventricosus TaxID=182803 RepID=A0A4Y2JVF6_ARAVE|nr:hypothetical protein AVEN_78409-1 [Araneus ventricosus]
MSYVKEPILPEEKSCISVTDIYITQAHGPDIALLIFGDHHHQQQHYLSWAHGSCIGSDEKENCSTCEFGN